MLDEAPDMPGATDNGAEGSAAEPMTSSARADPPADLAPPARPRRRRAAVREPGPPAPIVDAEPAAATSAPAALEPSGQAEPSGLDDPAVPTTNEPTPRKAPRRRRTAKAPVAAVDPPTDIAESPAIDTADLAESAVEAADVEPADAEQPAAQPPAAEPPAVEPAADQPAAPVDVAGAYDDDELATAEAEVAWSPADEPDDAADAPPGLAFRPPAFVAPAFVAPEPLPLPEPADLSEGPAPEAAAESAREPSEDSESDTEPAGTRRRRRGRRGRGRNRVDGDDADGAAEDESEATVPSVAAPAEPTDGSGAVSTPADPTAEDTDETAAGIRRRRRRRRRAGGENDDAESTSPAADSDDAVPTVVHVRAPRQPAKRGRDDDEVQGVKGSTRLEAKRQRRRDGRDGGRKRPTIISESEFLARREAVERVMVVRESADRTQIAVLEDGVLVEHYVTKTSASSFVGNVYLGRVQNVLPSMEAAFVDIGKGRNAVLYAGEVNYDASQFEGKPHRIEQALKSGDKVLVQVSKDPIGTKGSRLTSQISLPGRYVVYVPEGERTGISRKLPDTERARLKSILKRVAPEDAGLIVRTAAEGASEEELARDMARLVAQWEVIGKKAFSASPPTLLHAEPDLVIRVIRDVFNEDFATMVVQGDGEWETIEAYVEHVAPDLQERLERWTADGDVFAAYRVDEQLAKALDRKVWLPSGGYLIFDRTEAMVVVDVNTGRYTGKGGNLEETVTRNNLEAAEELARQLRLRDLGGMIVVDFIDMVLESNRDLVLRRLMECLGRDRTKHQVAEVTSLGLVQMTRKRVGQGLQDVFAQVCPECNGRGIKEIIDPFQPTVRAHPTPLAIPKPAPPRHRPEPAEAASSDSAEPPESENLEPADGSPNGEAVGAEPENSAQPADAEPADAQLADSEPADSEPADAEPAAEGAEGAGGVLTDASALG